MTNLDLRAVRGRSEDRRWLVLTVMCFTVLIISLDQTVMNVAIPTIVESLHPSSQDVQWIVDSYTLATAVCLLFGGALGDRFGRRRIFLLGVAIFGAGSLCCSLVGTTTLLIAMRGVMGIGAALLMPATLSIIVGTFKGRERARAIGIWAGITGIGASAGPLLGGWLLSHFWWGSIFLINVPIAVVAYLGCWFLVAEGCAEDPAPLDPIGVLLSSLGLTLITFAFIQAPNAGWASAEIMATLFAGISLLLGFAIWTTHRDRPLFDLVLFRNRIFSSALGAVTAMFFANFSVSYLLSQYLQFVLGFRPFEVGLALLPSAAGMMISANVSTRVAERIGLRRTMLAGMGMVTAAQAILVTMSVSTGYPTVGLAYALMGFGTGLSVAPASNAIVGTLPADKIGAGSGLRATVQLLGASFGVAVVGSIVTSHYRSVVNAAFGGPLRAVPSAARASVASQIGVAHTVAGKFPEPLARTAAQVVDHAFAASIRSGSLVSLCVLVAAMVAAARYVPREVSHVGEEDELLVNAAGHA